MRTQLILLNGGSSSGKSGTARGLQAVLADPWLAFGIDSFVDALPAPMQASEEGIVFAADGGVTVGAAFRTLEAAWMDGIVAMPAQAPGSSSMTCSSAGRYPGSDGRRA